MGLGVLEVWARGVWGKAYAVLYFWEVELGIKHKAPRSELRRVDVLLYN